MSDSSKTARGSVVALWRYPVKSMQGEELNRTEISRSGLLGDRAYALIDSANGKVASAKNPRKWPNLFDFRAALLDTPHSDLEVPVARITLPDGTIVMSSQDNIDEVLSGALQRQVALRRAAAPSIQPRTVQAEEYWPDMDGLDYRDTVTDFDLPVGTFFDSATVHVLTTATLDRLRALYPQGRWEVRRFRPNVVIDLADDQNGFVENGWVGRTLALGDSVRLQISGPCPRCVMTTWPRRTCPRILASCARLPNTTRPTLASTPRSCRAAQSIAETQSGWSRTDPHLTRSPHRHTETIMQPEDKPTLYDRLGGVYGIATVVDDFIHRIMVATGAGRVESDRREHEGSHRRVAGRSRTAGYE